MGIEGDSRVMEVGRCESRVSRGLSARVVCVQQQWCLLLLLHTLAAGDRCQCEETQSLAWALGLIVVRQC